ncbi:hypothetical protein J4050_14525 [Winogradskyella sp. DF17]|jgi:hypothetical protein|uniref:Uncharacterized protein n=1 Tax=Winogradskyella pelagia TaxID=2819984 RepID=A0ABS3T6P1_9FLAO|nr:hypothetical protein [Winogradskyella sp. DF17]MBO3117969.1 hypothetical protein [Winogradskyella sp. DF17]
MGKLNQDFRHRRLFDFIALIVFVLFLAFFANSILSVMGAFEMEAYTNTMAQVASTNMP